MRVMKIKALVAVRSGSVRVKNKNIRPFAGSSLLEVKLEQLKRISNLDGIIVNSNDENMLKIAQKHGVDVVKRDEYYSSNSVCMSDVYENMAENVDADVIVYANVTNPLISDQTIYNAIEFFKDNRKKYDSVNTAHLIKEFLWKDGVAFNYDPLNQPRSQDLPDIYALNFAVSIISKENMIRYKNVIGHHPYMFNTDYQEATDIDDEIDFEFAEYLYKKLNQKQTYSE